MSPIFCNFVAKNKMTLHIFNPEHDMALAVNLANFTAPHAGRQLRHDLGFLAALTAEKGDAVLVEDVRLAEHAFQDVLRWFKRNGVPLHVNEQISFVDKKRRIYKHVVPWGWDKTLVARLKKWGIRNNILLTTEQLDAIRALSHRRTAMNLLEKLQQDGVVGESFVCTSLQQVADLLQRYSKLVLKAPWSSSGRGIRFLDVQRTPMEMQIGWISNIFKSQGAVMAEPYYDKVKDFGMEFFAEADGCVTYRGLSLFNTVNGAYSGNILATESAKRAMLNRFLPLSLLDHVKDAICTHLSPVLKDVYHGPFGVDMMIVSGIKHDDSSCGFKLHPCVEINLRCTMGHYALQLTPEVDDIQGVMRIEYKDNSYKLKLERYPMTVNLV